MRPSGRRLCNIATNTTSKYRDNEKSFRTYVGTLKHADRSLQTETSQRQYRTRIETQPKAIRNLTQSSTTTTIFAQRKAFRLRRQGRCRPPLRLFQKFPSPPISKKTPSDPAPSTAFYLVFRRPFRCRSVVNFAVISGGHLRRGRRAGLTCAPLDVEFSWG